MGRKSGVIIQTLAVQLEHLVEGPGIFWCTVTVRDGCDIMLLIKARAMDTSGVYQGVCEMTKQMLHILIEYQLYFKIFRKMHMKMDMGIYGSKNHINF